MHLEFRHPNSKCARPARGGWAVQWLKLAYSELLGYSLVRAAGYLSYAESVGMSAEEIKVP
jgi:hypothetical protein